MTNSIYFLCNENACRGQIAEAYAKKYLPNWRINSAGVKSERIYPETIKVMAEDGIDISQQKSKEIDNHLFKNLQSSSLSVVKLATKSLFQRLLAG